MANDENDLLKRAERLKKSTADAKKSSRRGSKNAFDEASGHLSDIHKAFTQIKGTIGWIYSNIIDPIISHPWIGKPFQWYRRLWEKVVYIGGSESEQIFSKKRAGIMVICTLLFLKLLPMIFYGTVEFVWDSSRMLISYKSEEIFYLGKSQEIDSEGNVFSAQGCELIECSDQSSMYFRIKPSLAHHLWSFYHNGNVFFPDFVAAGIQNDINKCKVTGYGSRSKFMVRNWDVYPQILSVNCIPLTEEDIQAGKNLVSKKNGAEAGNNIGSGKDSD